VEIFISTCERGVDPHARERKNLQFPRFLPSLFLFFPFFQQPSEPLGNRDPMVAVIFQNTRRLKCRVLAAKFVTSAIDR